MPKKLHHGARGQGKNRKKHKYKSKPAEESSAHFKQVEIPGKGQGLVATAQLPVGKILIQESPLITANDGPSRDQEIVAKFRLLNDMRKNQLLSLHDPGPTSVQEKNLSRPESEDKAVRIFEENCLGLHYKEEDLKMSGLYKTISRINHSCAPNVVWSWIRRDKSKVVKQVRVIREIKEEEELLVRYWGAHEFASREERQNRLSPWNFNCSCEVCALTDDDLLENEKARARIRDLHTAINDKFDAGLPKQAYEAAKEKLETMRLIEKEVIVELPAALMECCEMAAFCKLPNFQANTTGLMKKAKDMSQRLGDAHMDLYEKYSKSWLDHVTSKILGNIK